MLRSLYCNIINNINCQLNNNFFCLWLEGTFKSVGCMAISMEVRDDWEYFVSQEKV